jgi:salicylate hydroxylase
LNAVIAGAGIAGLSAAISLRRAGYCVHVYEKSSMNNEIGAAIHVPPNAARFLTAWGLDPVQWRWVKSRRVHSIDPFTLEVKAALADEKTAISVGGVPWWLSHRVDLHDALKWLATRSDGPGAPVTIHVNSPVKGYVSCAPQPNIQLGCWLCC